MSVINNTVEAVLQNRKKTYVLLIIMAGTYLMLFSPYTTLLNDYFGYDTALWNVIGKGITQGKVPYRDLFDHKGPLLFFLYALGWAVGKHRVTMFIVQWIFFSATMILLYKVAVLYLNAKQSLGAIFFFLFLFCGTIGEGGMSEEWCLPFILLTMYLALAYVKNGVDEHRVVLGGLYGFCFGVIAMIRLNNAAPIAGIIIGFVVIMIMRKEYAQIWKNAVAFLVGMLIPIIPLAVWYWYKDSLEYLWWGAFVFNFKYASDALTARTLWDQIKPWLTVSPIIFLWVHLYREWKQNKENCRDREEGLLLFFASFMTVVMLMFGYSFMHYFTILLPCLFISAIFLIKGYKKECKRSGWLLIVGLLVTAAPFTWQAVRNVGKSILFNGFDHYGKMEEEIRGFLAQIPEQERNSVWGNGTSFSRVYCIGDITPCFPFIDNGPLHYKNDPNMQIQTDQMLKMNPPLWIVVATVGEPQIKGLQEVIDEKYLLFDTLEGEKHLELYRLK